MTAKSPYNWQSHSPGIQVPRTDVGRVADLLRENGSAVVMGGRGMGKSVFLGQLKTELENDQRTSVLLVDAPPAALTVDACLSGRPAHRRRDSRVARALPRRLSDAGRSRHREAGRLLTDPGAMDLRLFDG